MKNIHRYIDKEVGRIERTAERRARQWRWYQKYYLLINLLTPVAGGLIGALLVLLIKGY